MPYDEHSPKRRAGKRRWYHRNQADVRAQQALYLAERNAWKWRRTNTTGVLGHDEGISVVNLRDLKHPTYRLTAPLRPQWELCDCPECTRLRAAAQTTSV